MVALMFTDIWVSCPGLHDCGGVVVPSYKALITLNHYKSRYLCSLYHCEHCVVCVEESTPFTCPRLRLHSRVYF